MAIEKKSTSKFKQVGTRAKWLSCVTIGLVTAFAIHLEALAQKPAPKKSPGVNQAGRAKVSSSKTSAAKAPAAKTSDKAPQPKAPSRVAQKKAAPSSARVSQRPAPRASAPASATRYAGGPNWVKTAPQWTRTVRAIDPAKGTPVGEALALAIQGDYLVMPLDFVSDNWLAGGKTRFFAERQELSVVDLDLVSNLVLLRSNESTGPALEIQQIRSDIPTTEEALYAIVAKDWIRPGARFLRAKQDVTALRYQVALSGNDQLSARYIFDTSGKLVAISSGGEAGGASKNEVWAGSSRSLLELVAKQAGPKPASASGGLEQRRMQLLTWQDRWAQALAPSQQELSMRYLECKPHHVSIGERDLADSIHRLFAKSCDGRFSLPLGGGYTAGIQLLTGDAQIKPGKTVAAATDSQLVQSFAQAYFAEFNASTSLVNLSTTPECRDSQVTNRQGHEVNIRFCTAALKEETALNDTVVVVSSKESPTRVHLVAARLKGFGQMQTKRVLNVLVENVRGLK